MDYQGQKLAEMIYLYLIVILGAIGWVFGYVAQSFKITFTVWLGGLVVSMILCVPDWPMYNPHPVEWLKEIPASSPEDKATSKPATDDATTTTTEKVEKKKSRSKKR